MSLLLAAILLLAALQAPPAGTAGKPAAPSSPVAAGKAAPALPAPTPRAPAPVGLSWEDSDELERTLARLDRRLRSGRPASVETVAVTQRQLNSYLRLALASRLPAGVSDLDVAFQAERLSVRGQLDLDRVKALLPPGAASGFLAFMGGTVPVSVAGRFTGAAGRGRVEIEQASVGGVTLPLSMVVQLVALSTRNPERPAGFDIAAPFPLPWSARSVRLLPGRALVDF